MLIILIIILYIYNINSAFHVHDNCPQFLNSNIAFLDTLDFQCKRCDMFSPYAIPNDDGTGCICPSKYIIPEDSTADFIDCKKCPTGTAASQDQTRCIPCGDTTIYNSELGECVCNINEVTIEKGQNGQYLDEKICVLCSDPKVNFPGPHQPSRVYSCLTCPYGMKYKRSSGAFTCVCEETFTAAGHTCVSPTVFDETDDKFPVATAAQVWCMNIYIYVYVCIYVFVIIKENIYASY
eukprot:GHVR01076960.1.p1 GENE.GHVR01076960.1~~GHVR01076960.1.p1  ORF type:complete len:244 (+),score=53.66 GHVR01076960.1:24-734(+)